MSKDGARAIVHMSVGGARVAAASALVSARAARSGLKEALFWADEAIPGLHDRHALVESLKTCLQLASSLVDASRALNGMLPVTYGDVWGLTSMDHDAQA